MDSLPISKTGAMSGEPSANLIEGSSDVKTYYHVTTPENAEAIIQSGQLKNGKWESYVFAWNEQPTRREASVAGIGREASVVLKFDTTASFTLDAGNADIASIKNKVVQTVVGQRLPITIINIQNVGFKKVWWQFWKN